MKTILALGASLLLSSAMLNAGSLYEVPLKDIDGQDTTLGVHKGKALLIVNVASKCGYTKQYAGLEEIYQRYADQGLVVLGFPCNQFGGQEPGTNEEIKAFCTSTFDVTFPLFDKIEVNGDGRHPLYEQLAGDTSPFKGDIKWNFTKFLINRDGSIRNRFESKVAPTSEEMTAAIESALKSNP